MAKTRVVTRKYFSKKKQMWVEKTYTYTKDYDKRKVIVSKTGKVTKKGETIIKDMLSDMTLSEKNEAMSYIKQAQKNKDRLTDTGLKSKLAKNRREKMVINMGSSLDEALEILDADELMYFDETNWNGDVFTNPMTGKSFKFVANYEGAQWQQM